MLECIIEINGVLSLGFNTENGKEILASLCPNVWSSKAPHSEILSPLRPASLPLEYPSTFSSCREAPQGIPSSDATCNIPPLHFTTDDPFFMAVAMPFRTEKKTAIAAPGTDKGEEGKKSAKGEHEQAECQRADGKQKHSSPYRIFSSLIPSPRASSFFFPSSRKAEKSPVSVVASSPPPLSLPCSTKFILKVNLLSFVKLYTAAIRLRDDEKRGGRRLVTATSPPFTSLTDTLTQVLRPMVCSTSNLLLLHHPPRARGEATCIPTRTPAIPMPPSGYPVKVATTTHPLGGASGPSVMNRCPSPLAHVEDGNALPMRCGGDFPAGGLRNGAAVENVDRRLGKGVASAASMTAPALPPHCCGTEERAAAGEGEVIPPYPEVYKGLALLSISKEAYRYAFEFSPPHALSFFSSPISMLLGFEKARRNEEEKDDDKAMVDIEGSEDPYVSLGTRYYHVWSLFLWCATFFAKLFYGLPEAERFLTWKKATLGHVVIPSHNKNNNNKEDEDEDGDAHHIVLNFATTVSLFFAPLVPSNTEKERILRKKRIQEWMWRDAYCYSLGFSKRPNTHRLSTSPFCSSSSPPPRRPPSPLRSLSTSSSSCFLRRRRRGKRHRWNCPRRWIFPEGRKGQGNTSRHHDHHHHHPSYSRSYSRLTLSQFCDPAGRYIWNRRAQPARVPTDTPHSSSPPEGTPSTIISSSHASMERSVAWTEGEPHTEWRGSENTRDGKAEEEKEVRRRKSREDPPPPVAAPERRASSSSPCVEWRRNREKASQTSVSPRCTALLSSAIPYPSAGGGGVAGMLMEEGIDSGGGKAKGVTPLFCAHCASPKKKVFFRSSFHPLGDGGQRCSACQHLVCTRCISTQRCFDPVFAMYPSAKEDRDRRCNQRGRRVCKRCWTLYLQERDHLGGPLRFLGALFIFAGLDVMELAVICRAVPGFRSAADLCLTEYRAVLHTCEPDTSFYIPSSPSASPTCSFPLGKFLCNCLPLFVERREKRRGEPKSCTVKSVGKKKKTRTTMEAEVGEACREEEEKDGRGTKRVPTILSTVLPRRIESSAKKKGKLFHPFLSPPLSHPPQTPHEVTSRTASSASSSSSFTSPIPTPFSSLLSSLCTSSPSSPFGASDDQRGEKEGENNEDGSFFLHREPFLLLLRHLSQRRMWHRELMSHVLSILSAYIPVLRDKRRQEEQRPPQQQEQAQHRAGGGRPQPRETCRTATQQKGRSRRQNNKKEKKAEVGSSTRGTGKKGKHALRGRQVSFPQPRSSSLLCSSSSFSSSISTPSIDLSPLWERYFHKEFEAEDDEENECNKKKKKTRGGNGPRDSATEDLEKRKKRNRKIFLPCHRKEKARRTQSIPFPFPSPSSLLPSFHTLSFPSHILRCCSETCAQMEDCYFVVKCIEYLLPGLNFCRRNHQEKTKKEEGILSLHPASSSAPHRGSLQRVSQMDGEVPFTSSFSSCLSPFLLSHVTLLPHEKSILHTIEEILSVFFFPSDTPSFASMQSPHPSLSKNETDDVDIGKEWEEIEDEKKKELQRSCSFLSSSSRYADPDNDFYLSDDDHEGSEHFQERASSDGSSFSFYHQRKKAQSDHRRYDRPKERDGAASSWALHTEGFSSCGRTRQRMLEEEDVGGERGVWRSPSAWWSFQRKTEEEYLMCTLFQLFRDWSTDDVDATDAADVDQGPPKQEPPAEVREAQRQGREKDNGTRHANGDAGTDVHQERKNGKGKGERRRKTEKKKKSREEKEQKESRAEVSSMTCSSGAAEANRPSHMSNSNPSRRSSTPPPSTHSFPFSLLHNRHNKNNAITTNLRGGAVSKSTADPRLFSFSARKKKSFFSLSISSHVAASAFRCFSHSFQSRPPHRIAPTPTPPSIMMCSLSSAPLLLPPPPSSAISSSPPMGMTAHPATTSTDMKVFLEKIQDHHHHDDSSSNKNHDDGHHENVKDEKKIVLKENDEKPPPQGDGSPPTLSCCTFSSCLRLSPSFIFQWLILPFGLARRHCAVWLVFALWRLQEECEARRREREAICSTRRRRSPKTKKKLWYCLTTKTEKKNGSKSVKRETKFGKRGSKKAACSPTLPPFPLCSCSSSFSSSSFSSNSCIPSYSSYLSLLFSCIPDPEWRRGLQALYDFFSSWSCYYHHHHKSSSSQAGPSHYRKGRQKKKTEKRPPPPSPYYPHSHHHCRCRPPLPPHKNDMSLSACFENWVEEYCLGYHSYEGNGYYDSTSSSLGMEGKEEDKEERKVCLGSLLTAEGAERVTGEQPNDDGGDGGLPSSHLPPHLPCARPPTSSSSSSPFFSLPSAMNRGSTNTPSSCTPPCGSSSCSSSSCAEHHRHAFLRFNGLKYINLPQAIPHPFYPHILLKSIAIQDHESQRASSLLAQQEEENTELPQHQLETKKIPSFHSVLHLSIPSPSTEKGKCRSPWKEEEITREKICSALPPPSPPPLLAPCPPSPIRSLCRASRGTIPTSAAGAMWWRFSTYRVEEIGHRTGEWKKQKEKEKEEKKRNSCDDDDDREGDSRPSGVNTMKRRKGNAINKNSKDLPSTPLEGKLGVLLEEKEEFDEDGEDGTEKPSASKGKEKVSPRIPWRESRVQDLHSPFLSLAPEWRRKVHEDDQWGRAPPPLPPPSPQRDKKCCSKTTTRNLQTRREEREQIVDVKLYEILFKASSVEKDQLMCLTAKLLQKVLWNNIFNDHHIQEEDNDSDDYDDEEMEEGEGETEGDEDVDAPHSNGGSSSAALFHRPYGLFSLSSSLSSPSPSPSPPSRLPLSSQTTRRSQKKKYVVSPSVSHRSHRRWPPPTSSSSSSSPSSCCGGCATSYFPPLVLPSYNTIPFPGGIGIVEKVVGGETLRTIPSITHFLLDHHQQKHRQQQKEEKASAGRQERPPQQAHPSMAPAMVAPVSSLTTTTTATSSSSLLPISSCIAYEQSAVFFLVLNYLFAIGDRHEDNVMLHPDGALLHIDFGYVLTEKTVMEKLSGVAIRLDDKILSPLLHALPHNTNRAIASSTRRSDGARGERGGRRGGPRTSSFTKNRHRGKHTAGTDMTSPRHFRPASSLLRLPPHSQKNTTRHKALMDVFFYKAAKWYLDALPHADLFFQLWCCCSSTTFSFFHPPRDTYHWKRRIPFVRSSSFSSSSCSRRPPVPEGSSVPLESRKSCSCTSTSRMRADMKDRFDELFDRHTSKIVLREWFVTTMRSSVNKYHLTDATRHLMMEAQHVSHAMSQKTAKFFSTFFSFQ